MGMTIKELMAQVKANTGSKEKTSKKSNKFMVAFNIEEAKAKLAALPVNVMTECELIAGEPNTKTGEAHNKIFHAIYWGEVKDDQRQYAFITQNDQYGKTSGYYFLEFGILTDKNHGIDEVLKANNITVFDAESLKLVKALRRAEIDKLKTEKPQPEQLEEQPQEPVTEEEKPVQEIVPDVADGTKPEEVEKTPEEKLDELNYGNKGKGKGNNKRNNK